MDRFGHFNEVLGGELLASTAVRATLLRKVVVRSLQECTMIGANNGYVRLAVYILNL